jgi:hypothetical protein
MVYAESLSVLAYYFLVAGVILQILESVRSSKTPSVQKKSDPSHMKLTQVQLNSFLSLSFIALCILLLEAFILRSVEFA